MLMNEAFNCVSPLLGKTTAMAVRYSNGDLK